MIIVSGLIPKETAKLTRGVINRGGHKLAPKTFAIACIRGRNGKEAIELKHENFEHEPRSFNLGQTGKRNPQEFFT